MATPTYELIASSEFSTTTASVEFTGIATTWRDLILVFSGRHGASSITLTLNGSTSAIYNQITMAGNGSSTSSVITSSGTAFDFTASISSDFAVSIDIMSYRATTIHKPLLIRSYSIGQEMEGVFGRWASTSAVSSIQIASANSFERGRFYLYGIL